MRKCHEIRVGAKLFLFVSISCCWSLESFPSKSLRILQRDSSSTCGSSFSASFSCVALVGFASKLACGTPRIWVFKCQKPILSVLVVASVRCKDGADIVGSILFFVFGQMMPSGHWVYRLDVLHMFWCSGNMTEKLAINSLFLSMYGLSVKFLTYKIITPHSSCRKSLVCRIPVTTFLSRSGAA